MGARGIPAGRAALPAAGRTSILRILARSALTFKVFLRSLRLTFPNAFDR